jgi:hypothetical protein
MSRERVSDGASGLSPLPPPPPFSLSLTRHPPFPSIGLTAGPQKERYTDEQARKKLIDALHVDLGVDVLTNEEAPRRRSVRDQSPRHTQLLARALSRHTPDGDPASSRRASAAADRVAARGVPPRPPSRGTAGNSLAMPVAAPAAAAATCLRMLSICATPSCSLLLRERVCSNASTNRAAHGACDAETSPSGYFTSGLPRRLHIAVAYGAWAQLRAQRRGSARELGQVPPGDGH